jgi:hypothetical protein
MIRSRASPKSMKREIIRVEPLATYLEKVQGARFDGD